MRSLTVLSSRERNLIIRSTKGEDSKESSLLVKSHPQYRRLWNNVKAPSGPIPKMAVLEVTF